MTIASPTTFLLERRRLIGGSCDEVAIAFVKAFPRAQIYGIILMMSASPKPAHYVIRYGIRYYELEHPFGMTSLEKLVRLRYGRVLFSAVKRTPEQVETERKTY